MDKLGGGREREIFFVLQAGNESKDSYYTIF
jgi:hypothetical protein